MIVYYSVSFDEALNSVIQKCEVDVNIRYWDSTERKVKLVTLIHNSLREQMLMICLIVEMWVQQSYKKIHFYILQWMDPMLIGTF